jgi:PKD repeat protein
MIVRTGNMSLVVNDIRIAMNQIAVLADRLDGYVVASNVWGEDERLVGSITIRVAAEYFDDAMKALRQQAVKVNSESTSSKDVTEEYVDLSAKLQNLEATEEQLLKIMEQAKTVEEILNVQRELSKTRGEIEQTKGRMQYLERTSATSLIEVHLEQAKLEVKFNANKTTVKEGEEVQFTSKVAGGIAPYGYEWDFGDGNTSTSESPTHAYRTTGSYTVSLKVTDDRGNTDTETRREYIIVLPGWSAGSIASGAWHGLVSFGHGLAHMFIWIGIFSPVWLVIGGLVYWFWWRPRKRKRSGTS